MRGRRERERENQELEEKDEGWKGWKGWGKRCRESGGSERGGFSAEDICIL